MIDPKTALAQLALLLAETAAQRDQALTAVAELTQRVRMLEEAKPTEAPPAEA